MTDRYEPHCDCLGGHVSMLLDPNGRWCRADEGWQGYSDKGDKMPTRIDVIGEKFGRATVVADAPPAKSGRRRVACQCDCGKVFVCDPRLLRAGQTSSCGCLRRERVSQECKSRAIHGMARSREYTSWVKLRGRCKNPSDKKYAQYGGRGITVCQSWDESFESFLQDMGPKPFPDASVDRIDVNGPYSPENCRWASAKTQSRNKRNNRIVEFNGEFITLSEACEKAGVNYRSALYRMNVGKNWHSPPTPRPTEADHA